MGWCEIHQPILLLFYEIYYCNNYFTISISDFAEAPFTK